MSQGIATFDPQVHELARHVRKADLVRLHDGREAVVATDYRRKANRIVEVDGDPVRVWTADIAHVKRGKAWKPVYVPVKLVRESQTGKLPALPKAEEPKPKAKPKKGKASPKGKGKKGSPSKRAVDGLADLSADDLLDLLSAIKSEINRR